MRDYNSFNDYNSYTNMFDNPYNFKRGGANKSVSKLWIKKLAEQRKEEELRFQTNDRSMLDRGLDLLSSVNYGVAGFAHGLVDDKGGLGTAFKRAGQGLAHGLNIFSNDTSDEHEYTFSRVMGEAGWNPTSLGGKIARGVLGFGLDVLLDPTTYLSFGTSALLKGTGKAGKGIEAIEKVAKEANQSKFINDLVDKGIDVNLATRYAEKKGKTSDAFKGATHMDEDMAREIVKAEMHKSGRKMTAEEIELDAKMLSGRYNKLAGLNRTAGYKGITFGIENMMFGDLIAPKLGKLGKTLTIADNSDSVAQLSDKLKISSAYAKVRDHIYGKKITDLISNNAKLYKLSQQDPAQVYKLLKGAQITKGLDGDKISKEKMIRDQAKAMNMELSPAEMKEVIKLMEDPSQWKEISKVFKFADTQKAKELKQALNIGKGNIKKQVDEMRAQRRNLDQIKHATDENVAKSQEAFDMLHREYIENLKKFDLQNLVDPVEARKMLDSMKAETSQINIKIAQRQMEHAENSARVLVDIETKAEKLAKAEADKLKAEADAKSKEPKQKKEVKPVDKEQMTKQGLALTMKKIEEEDKAFAEHMAKVQKFKKIEREKKKQQRAEYNKQKAIHSRNIKDNPIDEIVNEINARYDQMIGDLYKLERPKGRHKRTWTREIQRKAGALENKRVKEVNEQTAKLKPEQEYIDVKPLDDGMHDIETIDDVVAEAVKRETEEMMMDAPGRPTRFQLIDDLSTYIFGVPDRLLYNMKQAQLKDLIQKVTVTRLTPDEVQNYIMDNARLYSEQMYEVTNFLANKYRYATWEKAYVKPMENLAKIKNENGGALPAHMERDLLALRDLEETRQRDFYKFMKMEYDEFKAERLKLVNVDEMNDLHSRIDIDNITSRRLRFADDVRAGRDEYREATVYDEFLQDFGGGGAPEHSLASAYKEDYDVSWRQHMEAQSADDLEQIKVDVNKYYIDSINQKNGGRDMFEKRTAQRIAHDDKRIEKIEKVMHSVMYRSYPGLSYSELSPSRKSLVLREALNQASGNKSFMTLENGRLVIEEAQKREAKTRQQLITDWVKKGTNLKFNNAETGRNEVGKVVDIETTDKGSLYTVELLGGVERQIYANDIKEVKLIDKSATDVQTLIKESKFTQDLIKQRDELIENMDNLQTKLTGQPAFQKQRQDAINYYTERLNQAKANITRYESKSKKVQEAIANLDEKEIDRLTDQINELDKALATDDALENWARMHNEHTVQNLTNPDRWSHVKSITKDQRHSDVPEGAHGYANNGEIYLIKDNPPQSNVVKSRYKYFKDRFDKDGFDSTELTKIFKDRPERLTEYLLEHEQSHIANKDSVKSYKRKWGDTEHDNVEYRADIDAFNMVKSMNPEQIMKDEFGEDYLSEGAKIALDNSGSSDKVIKWAKVLREQFDEMAKEEIKIGKLDERQFAKMMDKYVPHILTEDGRKYFDSLKSLDEHKASITQDLGYGLKWNPYKQSRTIHGKSIDEINDFFRDKLKGKNIFATNIADIYVARAMKHEELMYDNKYMKEMMDVFGTKMKPTDKLARGFKAVVNYGTLKDTIAKQVRIMIQEAKQKGEKPDKAMWDKYTDVIIKKLGLPKGILDDFATPMVELSRDQIKTLSPHGIVYSVNDIVADKANQARKLSIAKNQNRALQMYDKFLHFMKLNQTTVMPNFHLRNKVSNMYLNWLGVGRDALNPTLQKNSFLAVHHRGDAEKLKQLRPLTLKDADGNIKGIMHWNEVYELAKVHGVVDEGFFAREIGAGAISKGLAKGKLNKEINGKQFSFDPTDTGNFVLYKYGAEVGGRIENGDRLLHFASQLRRGLSPEEASDSVNKFLFDYSDLTGFEQSVMKRIFPYYTWLRKNARLQVDQMIDQPGKYRDTAKAMHAVNDMNNEDERVDRRTMMPFAQDWIQSPFGKEGNPIMMNPALPIQDLNRIPNPLSPVDSARQLFSQTAPLPKNAVELATNQNVFFDEKITEEGENPAVEVGKHLANQASIPSFLLGLVEKEGLSQNLHVMNWLTGVKGVSYDEEGMLDMQIADGKARNVGEYETLDRIGELAEMGAGAFKEFGKGIMRGLEKISPARPTSAIDYTGALRPISEDRYNELPDSEKEKYTPPTKKEAVAYHKRALELSKEEYEKSGVFKKFVWTLLDKFGDDEPKPDVGRVLDVSDGDTITVKVGNKLKDVRMMLVDTPETVDPRLDFEMPEGKKASNFTKSMLQDQDVKLVYEGTEKDKYGRYVAYVVYNDEDYNKILIEEGMGKTRYTYKDYPKNSKQYSKTDEYYEAENKAKRNKKGIWQDKYKGYSEAGFDVGYDLDAVRRYLERE